MLRLNHSKKQLGIAVPPFLQKQNKAFIRPSTGMTLDEFLEKASELDFIERFMKLVDRAMDKIDANREGVVKKDSPLSPIRFLVKGRAGRPLHSYFQPKGNWGKVKVTI